MPILNLSFNNTPLQKAFDQIETQTNYHFFYKTEWIADYKVSDDIKNEKLIPILEKLLKNTDLNYILRGNNIILTKNVLVYQSLPEGYFEPDSIQINTTRKQPLLKPAPAYNNSLIPIGKQTAVNNQETFTVSGIVTDKKTGEPIKSLIITTADRNIYTTTSETGSYKLTIPAGFNQIETSILGYEKGSYDLMVYGDGRLNITLMENSELLGEVLVESDKDKNLKKAALGVNSINISELKLIPQVLGERDILKAALTLPGISTAGEGANGYNVRGGRSDQNLILLDDAVLYAPSHFLGFFSAVNPFTTAKVDIYKASIPAEYGGRLSSVIDIETKKGNMNKFSGEGSIGPLTANLKVEIPIVKEKASLTASVRATYTGWILRSLSEESLQNSEASFYDGTLKYTHLFNKKNSIEVTGYYSRDRFSITTDSLYDYENLLASVKWNTQLSEKTKAEFIVSNTQYGYNIIFDGDANSNFDYGYSINETQLKSIFNYTLNDKNSIQYGLSTKLYGVNVGEIKSLGEMSDVQPVKLPNEQGLESAIYASDTFTYDEKLLFDFGFRLSMFNALGRSTQNFYESGQPKNEGTQTRIESYGDFEVFKTYLTPEFRFSTRYFLTSSFSVKAAFNNSAQYIHQLTSNTTVSPTDVWKLSDINIKPQRGKQYSLGFFKNINKDGLELSLEGYYKTMSNILDYKTGADLTLNENIERELLQGKGQAYGVEFLLKKEKGNLNGYFGYTYSRTELKLDSSIQQENINNGRYFPANYDKPHDLSLVMNYKLTTRYSFSLNFVYQTGRPVTYPTGKFSYAGQEQVVYSDRNRFRIPDYYRLDLGINIEGNHKIKKLAHSFWNISVYNVLGRNNPYSVFFINDNGEIKAYKTSIFSIPVPTITYNLKF